MRFCRRVGIGGIVAGATLVLGCASGPWIIRDDPASSIEEREKYLVFDRELYEFIRLVKSRASRTSDGRLVVDVELKNITSRDLVLQVQTVFRDEQHFLSGDSTTWQHITIPPYSTHNLHICSLSPKAVDFNVRIGPSRVAGRRGA